MANLDTRSKRASSVNILLPFILAPILPDGTIDGGDRQHIALSYSGIATTSSPLAAGDANIGLVAFKARAAVAEFTDRTVTAEFTQRARVAPFTERAKIAPYKGRAKKS